MLWAPAKGCGSPRSQPSGRHAHTCSEVALRQQCGLRGRMEVCGDKEWGEVAGRFGPHWRTRGPGNWDSEERWAGFSGDGTSAGALAQGQTLRSGQPWPLLLQAQPRGHGRGCRSVLQMKLGTLGRSEYKPHWFEYHRALMFINLSAPGHRLGHGSYV